MPVRLEKTYADDACSLYTWRSLVVIAWRRTPTLETVPNAGRAMLEITKHHTGKIVLCAIASPAVTAPDAATRESLERYLKSLDDRCTGAVNVVLARGFVAAAVRGMLTGFSLILRPKYPTSFVATLLEGATFVIRHWPGDDVPAASDLENALTEIAPI
jgi:hypothetical protein